MGIKRFVSVRQIGLCILKLNAPVSVIANISKPILQKKATHSPDRQLVTSQVADAADQVSSPTADTECEPDHALLHTKTLLKKPNLTMSKMCLTSLPLRPIYHPAVIKASKSIHGGKHPSELTQEEASKIKPLFTMET